MNDKSPHPFAHIKSAQLYEWMRQDCAALVAARQSREDSLIQTITQISSAALLAIPGLLLTSDLGAPNFADGWLLYFGSTLFVCALVISMLEQHFSAAAYKIHETVVQKYYLLESLQNCDQRSIDLVNRLRISACILFALAVLMSAFGLVSLMEEYHGKPSTTATTATTATTTSPAALTSSGVRGQRNTEIGSVANSASTKAMKNE